MFARGVRQPPGAEGDRALPSGASRPVGSTETPREAEGKRKRWREVRSVAGAGAL